MTQGSVKHDPRFLNLPLSRHPETCDKREQNQASWTSQVLGQVLSYAERQQVRQSQLASGSASHHVIPNLFRDLKNNRF